MNKETHMYDIPIYSGRFKILSKYVKRGYLLTCLAYLTSCFLFLHKLKIHVIPQNVLSHHFPQLTMREFVLIVACIPLGKYHMLICTEEENYKMNQITQFSVKEAF